MAETAPCTNDEHIRITERALALLENWSRPVIFEINITLTIGLIAQLQLAFRHPANTGATRQMTEAFVRELIEKIDPWHGDIYSMLMMGFDSSYDAKEAVDGDSIDAAALRE